MKSNILSNYKRAAIVFCLFILGIFTSCLENGNETIILEDKTNNTGIPSDSQADPNPNVGTTNSTIPNFQYTVEEEDGDVIIRLDLTGIQNPQTSEWMKLVGTGNKDQNVWVSVDGKPKGISVTNNADEHNNNETIADVVFLVDNSGSMSEEADAIARDIISWASTLLQSNLNARFGCVGYDDGYISGAINMTTSTSLSTYLNRYTGTSRTKGYSGNDAIKLQDLSSSYSNTEGECGVAALRLADENFTFRSNANRIYINFTDEPNQPGGNNKWSVEYVNKSNNWDTSKGTIHTVYSDANITFTEQTLYKERPWRLSQYTGGTELYTSSSFSGISLNVLPVTGAMQNSYVIRFTNVNEFMDGKTHIVKITILDKDKKVRAERTFSVIFRNN